LDRPYFILRGEAWPHDRLTLPVSDGPPTTMLKEPKKAYQVGRPLHWLVRS